MGVSLFSVYLSEIHFLSNEYQRSDYKMNNLHSGRNNRWMIRKRRKNRGKMLSLLGLGIGSVAIYGMTSGNRMIKTGQPILNRFNNS